MSKKLKQKLKNLDLEKNVKKLTNPLLAGFTICLTLLLSSFYGPQIHNSYIRSVVGSKVVMMVGAKSGGTGFHVTTPSGKTVILTNAHICLLGTNDYINVKNPITHRLMPRKILKRAQRHDLCVVEALPKFKGLLLASAPLTGDLGDETIAVGHPLLAKLTITKGEYIGDERINMVFGYNLPDNKCIGVNRKLNALDMLRMLFGGSTTTPIIVNATNNPATTICETSLEAHQITTKILPGNSGSPLVNKYGNVTGVVFAYNSRSVNGFVVPLEYVREFLKGL